MDFAIDLDNPHQLLEVYNANPTQKPDGDWYCLHYGQIAVKDLDSPQFKRGTLCFPWDMQMVYRELSITIDGKQCWLWRESFGPESLELATAIATQDWLAINETGERVQERIPAAKTLMVVTQALNWLQSHHPAALEWLLFVECDLQVQAHVDVILDAVIRQDAARLQQAMFDKTGETLSLEQWHPRPGYADPGNRMFVRAVEIATDSLLRRDPQLVRWFVTNALNLPYEIQKQLLTKVKVFELLFGNNDSAAGSEVAMPRVQARYKRGAQERSLEGIKQKATAIVKDGRVVDFKFDSTGDLELDEAIKAALARIKDRLQLPAKTKNGNVPVNIVFQEK